jgi:1,4-dihydroxy-2-naphthoate octaprenyltransferase
MTTELLRENQSKLWYAAIKIPMYTVAVIPIIVGTGVAFANSQEITWQILGTFLGSAIAIIAWLNVSNDVFDADTGIDKKKLTP